MKRLSNLLAALVFASLVIFMSCGGGGGDDGPSDLEIAVDNLTISGGFSNPTTVRYNDGNPDASWDTFGIAFTGSVDGGTYTVSNVPTDFGDVWADGTWTINSDANVITRVQDGVTTNIIATIGEGSLTLEFDVDDPTARPNGIAGSWIFIFN